MRWRTIAAVSLTIAAMACARHPETAATAPTPAVTSPNATGWTRLATADMNAEQRAAQQRAMEAVKAMAGRLMGRLEGALDAGDPAAAVEVCRSQAPGIATEIATEYGVRIGRTSYRLRNPANVPPPWARPLVDERVAGPVWLAGPDGRLAGLLPIRLKAECGMCHGPKEEIAPEVRSALARDYPKDAATGFHPGDLRGWFWVETGPSR